jgi:hypothetical protein
VPGIGGLVSFLSTDVSARLAAAGYPPLTDGGILIGRQHVLEQSRAPRIVFVPLTSTFGPRDTYNRSNLVGSPSAEMLLQWAQRSIHSEIVRFEIHVWGQATPPDPEGGDFDATQVLYQCVIQSVRANITGGYTLLPGVWADQTPSAAQLQKAGHEFVFGLEISTPVLDNLLSYAPSGTATEALVEFTGDSAEGIIIITS